MNKTTHKSTARMTAYPASAADEELLIRYRDQGDRQAFAELVRRYERELYNYLRRFLGDDGLAEEAFQGTFLQLHLKCHQFESGRKLRPWLYTIALNQAIDVQRKNKRHRRLSLDRGATGDGDEVGTLLDLVESKELSPQFQQEENHRRQWVRQAVEELPEPLRQVVELIYYQGLKYREAADVLGIPVGTAKSRMHAALLKLNEALRADEPRRFEQP